MVNLGDGLRQLEETFQLTDLLLPFLLIFVIFYAILTKTNILGKDKRNWNTAVALVVALMAVIPHMLGYYPSGSDPVEIINNALPNVSIILVAIVMFLILIGLVGGNFDVAGTKLTGWVIILAAILIFIIFARAAGWLGPNLPSWLRWLNDSSTQALIVVILVLAVVVWFITREEKQTEGPKMWDDFGKWIKGKQ
jgi:hypothetical protein